MYKLYVDVGGVPVYVGEDYRLENVYRIIGIEENKIKWNLGCNILHWTIYLRDRLVEEYMM